MKKQATADGSDTLISDLFGESYHSKHGAITESNHVFIQAGLLPFLEKNTKIKILEIGFGTGLNALLTILATEGANSGVHYVAYEYYPITAKEASLLNYPTHLQYPQSAAFLSSIHESEWSVPINITPNFVLEKRQETFEDLSDVESYDLIYMDAFAPTAQPSYWEVPFVTQLAISLKPGGVLVTYCAKGSFKRALKEAGFDVEGLPGPPGKREMTRAQKR